MIIVSEINLQLLYATPIKNTSWKNLQRSPFIKNLAWTKDYYISATKSNEH